MKYITLFLTIFTLCSCASQPASLSTKSSVPLTLESLVLQGIDGKIQSHLTERLVSRQVLLVFWQPWCWRCRAEAPLVEALYKQHQQTTDIFGVVSGKPEHIDEGAVRRAINDWGISYPTLRDRDLSITQYFKVTATPTFVLIGRDGKVLHNGHAIPKL